MNWSLIKNLMKLIIEYFFPITIFVLMIFYGLSLLEILSFKFQEMIIVSSIVTIFIEIFAMLLAFLNVKKKR